MTFLQKVWREKKEKEKMLQRAARNAYSWWAASHIRTKQSKWLQQNLQGNSLFIPIPIIIDLVFHSQIPNLFLLQGWRKIFWLYCITHTKLHSMVQVISRNWRNVSTRMFMPLFGSREREEASLENVRFWNSVFSSFCVKSTGISFPSIS